MDSNMYPNPFLPPPSLAGAADSDPKANNDYLNSVPPGFRFSPNDAELIKYLNAKIDDFIVPRRILEVDVYKHSPQQLNDEYNREGEKRMYFFTPRSRKYPKGNLPDRAAGGVGFWKATGADCQIKQRGSNDNIIGFKKTLVFHIGKPKDAVKTNWIMQEFTLNKEIRNHHQKKLASSGAVPCKLDDWVLCKIYKTERKSSRGSQNEVAIPTEVVKTPILQGRPNQHSQAQHLQNPLSFLPISSCSLLMDNSSYPNSFPPPHPALPLPPLENDYGLSVPPNSFPPMPPLLPLENDYDLPVPPYWFPPPPALPTPPFENDYDLSVPPLDNDYDPFEEIDFDDFDDIDMFFPEFDP